MKLVLPNKKYLEQYNEALVKNNIDGKNIKTKRYWIILK